MRRDWLLVFIISLLIGLCSRTEAEVLCRDQNGAVSAREACRKAETDVRDDSLLFIVGIRAFAGTDLDVADGRMSEGVGVVGADEADEFHLARWSVLD